MSIQQKKCTIVSLILCEPKAILHAFCFEIFEKHSGSYDFMHLGILAFRNLYYSYLSASIGLSEAARRAG